MKNELGPKGMIIFSIILSLSVWVLPAILLLIILPIAFIFALLGLMRSIKTKQTGSIILAIIACLLPIVIYLMFSSIRDAAGRASELQAQDYINRLNVGQQ